MSSRERLGLHWWYFRRVWLADHVSDLALAAIFAESAAILAVGIALRFPPIPWWGFAGMGVWLLGSIGVLLWDAQGRPS